MVVRHCATSNHVWVSVVMLTSLIVVFCGVLNKLAGLLLGPGERALPRETVSASNLAAMSLPLGTLLLFTVWLPVSIRQLMDQAANIIRGLP